MVYKQNNGWTLIEVLAAVAIISIGLVSALFLTTYNLTAENQSQKRLLAFNFAKETLEVLRASRDSDWLAGNPAFTSWQSWSGTSNAAYSLINFIPQAVNSNSLSSCGNGCKIFRNNNSTWPVYGVSSGLTTDFSRLFTLKPICWDSTSQGVVLMAVNQDCSAYAALAGYEVEAVVGWQFNGVWKEVRLIERLYDWR